MTAISKKPPSGPIGVVHRLINMNVGAVGAAACLDHVVAAPGFPEAELGDTLIVSCAALTANLGIVNAFPHVAGGFTVRFINPTAAPIDPAALDFRCTLIKKGPDL